MLFHLNVSKPHWVNFAAQSTSLRVGEGMLGIRRIRRKRESSGEGNHTLLESREHDIYVPVVR